MSIRVDKFINPEETPPDIFRAARNDDVAELLAALAEGQSLATQNPDLLLMTPVHVAAARKSNEFLAAASHHESFDPHIRDANQRTAIDHANAHMNERGHEILFDTMYGDLHAPDNRHIDYSDNAPSEFYPEV